MRTGQVRGERKWLPATSDSVVSDVITTGQYPCDEGGICRTGQNDVVTRNDVIRSPLRDAHVSENVDATCTDENGLTPDDVTGESRSERHWQLFYVMVASLAAFIACLTSMSPSCVIFVVTVTSLIAHHVIHS